MSSTKAARAEPLASVTVLNPTAGRVRALQAHRALALPFLFTIALMGFGFWPSVRLNPRLSWAFWGTGAVLLAWSAVLLSAARHRSRTFAVEIVLRKQHYLQACAQGSILLYWGWYWREVYHSAHLLAAQILFAYAFDMLLAWSRRDTYTLGFAPFPVVFSVNLFLWFKPDWFYLQFLLLAVGFAAKELIRWNKEGRWAHIFNPSSFPLGLFSLGLILTGTTDVTWGREIAITQFNPPNIYLMIFLVGLPGQFLFGVTTMTMSAVVTTYLFGLLYFAATGTYYFLDSYVPIAAFLGMHLLFTDPSTAPRTELGRIGFGILYGLSIVTLAAILGTAGAPTFYDKLLAVPILNLMIRGIDRLVRTSWLKRFDPAKLGAGLSTRQRNLVYMSVWALVFAGMSAVNAVGDTHRGRWLPFWQEACGAGKRNACRNLLRMESIYCGQGSGWACNELGILSSQVRNDGLRGAVESFQRACSLGFEAGCDNLTLSQRGSGQLKRVTPEVRDYLIMLQEGKGPLPPDIPRRQLFERACEHGWTAACENLRMSQARIE